MSTDTVNAIAARLARAQRVLFITGAGMSVDSGLPTYRGVGGLYDGVETDEGMSIEEALSGQMFRRDPAMSWKYIMQIEQACRGAKPNHGHIVMAELEQRFDDVWVLTQNVDGLHRAAGSTRIIDIHGDVRALMCTGCDWREHVDDYTGLDCPPLCPACQAVVRPDVVLFGEMLPTHKTALLSAQLSAGFDAVLSVGTTSVFPYIAQPVFDARRRGALSVEINPGQTLVSEIVEYKLELGASDALRAIVDALG
jgi:NAD-dependent deacetylase